MTIHPCERPVTGSACERREVLLSIQDVHAELGDRVVLRGVDAAIRNIVRAGVAQGQVVGVLGPSGSGKTTLLRILAGLAAPSRGRVLVEGAPVRAGDVGVVFQRCPLLEHRTVLGNLTASGASADRARELLARFGLAARADAWPCELSGGERQRVAILQQLVCGHTYLLMDEPFSALDPVHKARACELIVEVSRLDERNTIVVVTHDIPEAVKVCDTLWLLGRERAPAAPSGAALPGSRIVETYDLVARELAWREGIERTPRFAELVREVTDRFAGL
jgi:polar amino acid transport system ATP-binding protein/sulfate transport system ATP-binding protein